MKKPLIQRGEKGNWKIVKWKNVTVRLGSSDGALTLQIPEGASRQIEIRYR